MSLAIAEVAADTWPKKVARNYAKVPAAEVAASPNYHVYDDPNAIFRPISPCFKHHNPNSTRISSHEPQVIPVIDRQLVRCLPLLDSDRDFYERFITLWSLTGLSENSTWPRLSGRQNVIINQPLIVDPFSGFDEYSRPDWDGYGAEIVSAATLAAARQFYRVMPRMFGAPAIAPASDGSIGFEWVFDSHKVRKLFIDIGPGKVWSCYWRLANNESETIHPKAIDESTEAELAALFNRLSA